MSIGAGPVLACTCSMHRSTSVFRDAYVSKRVMCMSMWSLSVFGHMLCKHAFLMESVSSSPVRSL
eukprot:2802409-Pyramimonas_sp.AAC.1